MNDREHLRDYQENRWATVEEFKDGLKKQRIGEPQTASGVPLMTEDGDIYVDDTDSHTLIFGNTGSKKTRNFCIPAVFALGNAGESMIISDPKGEIYRNTSGFLKSRNYRIQVINLRDMDYGCQWNPLTVPYQQYRNGEKDIGMGMVSDLCYQLSTLVHTSRDPFWEMAARELLEALIMILFECAESEDEVNMSSVKLLRDQIHVISEYGDGQDDPADLAFWEFLESFPGDSVIAFKLATVISLKKTERTLPSILVTIDAMLNPFIIRQGLIDMTWYSEVDYNKIAKKKTALFLLIPDETRSLHILVSIFVKQCYEQLIAIAQRRSELQLKCRVNFVLDEFSNFPKIADMPAMISAARSRNIRFLLVVQSRQQLYAQYKEEAETIRSNCRNWIFLASREIELLEEIRKLCGDTWIEGEERRPLISVTGLQRLQIGRENSQALILRPQKAPFISCVRDFSLYPGADIEPVPLQKRKKRRGRVIDITDYYIRRLEGKEDA